MPIRPEFKKPLRVTWITLAVVLVLGVVGITWIQISEKSGAKANRRAQLLGSGLGLAAGLVIGPFWIAAAGKVGKTRREQRLKDKTRAK